MENYYKEFYSSEDVNRRLDDGFHLDTDSDQEDFIIADKTFSGQDSISST